MQPASDSTTSESVLPNATVYTTSKTEPKHEDGFDSRQRKVQRGATQRFMKQRLEQLAAAQ